MKINLHENGWTGIAEDLDFAKITQEEVNRIGQFLSTNLVLVIRNQGHLTVDDQIKFGSMLGTIRDRSSQAQNPPWKYWQISGSDNKIMRVTGELDEHGQPGLFGHVSDLDWHCNGPADEVRFPLVWLLGVKGTEGSRTSWSNSILPYANLDPSILEELKDLKMVCGFKQGNYTEIDFGKDEDFNEHNTPKIVHTNEGGKTGLFFPFLQFRNFVGMSKEQSKEIIIKLKDILLQDKYLYHHEWQDGDVVIAEQWLSIHKRWEFAGMPNRVLWRMELNYDNIDFSV
jgi:alpha-ketoglutarate-dependent taurine dioxygenase